MYAAAETSRLTADWAINVTSANAEILISRKAVISRCRQLERDDVYMRRILRLFQNNVIGHHGIRLEPKILSPGTGDYDRPANALLRDAWVESGKRANCTVTKTLSRLECQGLTMRALIRDGGILWRKRVAFPNPFGFAIEPIEIDRLDHDLNRPATQTTNKIQFGIEVDQFDAPVAYHILTRHPGDVFAYRSSPHYRERVLADEIIPVWSPERAGQLVGMPMTSAILKRLNHLDNYDEAELIAARVAACKGGFFTKKNSEQYEGEEDEQGNTITEMQPGVFEELPIGMDFTPNHPEHPTQAYPAFVKTQLRGAASGVNLSYNALANDLEGVNYSSLRAGLIEDREEYKYLQSLLIEQLMDPWFEAWLPLAIMSGQLALPFGEIKRLKTHAWRARRWAWVDPLKDVQADMIAIEGGLTSRRHVIAENGEDVEQVFNDQEQDQALADDHGLVFIVDKPKVGTGAVADDNPPGEPPGAKDQAEGRTSLSPTLSATLSSHRRNGHRRILSE